MSAYTFPLFAVLAVFVVFTLAAAWWHQRRYIQHLQAQLLHNDQSRRALAEQLLALRQQLEAGMPLMARSDLEVRRDELERMLAASAVAPGPWQDTMPSQMMEFGPTEPAPLERQR